MLLSGCMGSALLAFFWGYAQPDRPRAQARWYLAFYGLSALAVLTKGPVGIVLPVLIIAAFLLYVGNLPQVLREMQVVRGCLLFLAIALPWYVLVIWANGEDYIRAFFGYHNLERFTRVVNNHWAPIWYYLAVVPLAFLPWSAYLPIAIARLRFWHVDHWRQQPRFTHLGLFALVWLVIIFGFFTIAVTKLPSYMLPLMPAAAILVGLFWSDQMTHPPSKQAGSRAIRRSVWLSHLLNISLALTLAAVVFYSPNWLGNDPEFPHLAEVVRQSGITLIGGSIWILVAAIELVLLLRRQSYWIWAVQLVGFIAFVLLSLLPLVAMVDMQRQLPLRQLAATIEQVQHPEEPIIMVGYGKPSLVFYSHRSVTFISQPSDALDTLKRLSHHPGAANSLLLLGRPSKLKEAGIYPDQYKILSETEVYRLARMTLSAKPE
jgi:4-amino-4-deoxy-L-arabinose transferase-like glycosyltransferase